MTGASTVSPPAPGTTLTNRAVVIDTRTSTDGRVVVLCVRTDAEQGWLVSRADVYATWELDDAGNTYWGHYFGSLAEAQADLTRRAT